MEQKTYYLGLDMGTNSVGWAVTDENYNLLRAKGKDLWGIREFESASGAIERRAHRVSRRNRQRQQVRVGKLNCYFEDAINEVDPSFYARLRNSKYHLEDKEEAVRTPNGIFNDPDYKDKDYYAQYPTIYHLRKELLTNDEPHDVRLVYLALLNMFKHRGHFLNAALTSEGTRHMQDAYNSFQENVYEMCDLSFPDVDGKEIEAVLSNRDLNRSRKSESLMELFHFTKKENKTELEFVKGMCGLTTEASKLFGDLGLEEKVEICFSKASYEDRIPDIMDAVGEENFRVLENLKEIADIGTLAGVLKGYTYLSEARVAEYEKHKSDLKLLKSVIRQYGTQEDYTKMFRSEESGTYSAYVNSYNSGKKQRRDMKGRTREDFYKSLKKLLKGMPAEDENVAYISSEIDKEKFLPKQLTASNGVIPNQVHLKEMKAILKNAEQYLPFLKEVDESGLTTSERIWRLFSFQIPYYVGPVTPNSSRDGGNGWVVRKEDGEILPWNINEKIDLPSTQDAFIKRLVRECTYISGEKVLPKGSLIYEKFAVLNEINNIRIDNERLDTPLKQAIYNDLFCTGKRITRKRILDYLSAQGKLKNESQLTGIDKNINNSLSSYGKFLGVFGEDLKKDHYIDMSEDIIYWCTVYGDSKKVLRSLLEKKYKGELTEKQMKRILGFKFGDWGRMSREFLELEGIDKETGEVVTLIHAMWENSMNMMELIHSDRFTFAESLESKKTKMDKTLSEFKHEDLDEYYFSAPVKRMIWQTLLVIKELEKVLGGPPARLFVEMTRSDDIKGDKGRKKSRKDELLDLYKKVKDESHDWAAIINDADKNGTIRSKKMYLYLTQRGRCMYTGKPIDLNQLFDNNIYDIDHIYPRHYVKDDNLRNNLVLVDKRANARKSDNYPIDSNIRCNDSIKALWYSLKKENLISEEKYRRLTGSNPFTDEQKAGFIARQMVETSQATKGVNDLLKQLLPDAELVYSKASNVSDFRRDYDLLKSRTINDFHHANDAYLNIVVGNVFLMKFTNNPRNFIKEYNRDKYTYGYNLGKIFERDVKRGDQVAWIADDGNGNHGTIETVKKVIAKNTPLLTVMNFTERGTLYDVQPITSKKAKEKVYHPLKTSDEGRNDVTKYGGYQKIKNAYYFLVEHEMKGKRIRTLEALPINIAHRAESDDNAILEYCLSELHLVNPSIRLKCVKMQSLLKVDGFYSILRGKAGDQIVLGNATSLCLNPNWNNYIHLIDKYFQTGYMNRQINKDDNIKLYNELLQKHQETIFNKRANSIGKVLVKGKEQFDNLDLKKQCEVINNILSVSNTGIAECNLLLIGGSAHTGKMQISKNLSIRDSVMLVNRSVTGIFETVIDMKTV